MESKLSYQDTVNLLIAKGFNFSEIELIMEKIELLDAQGLANIIKQKAIEKTDNGALKC